MKIFLKMPFLGVVLIGIIIAIIYALSIFYSLFYEIWWLDIPMHFLGGLWIALLSAWFFSHFSFFYSRKGNTKFVWSTLVFLVILIGVLWEIFEYTTGIAALPSEYWFDTLLDMVMDFLGVVVGAWYIVHIFKKETPAGGAGV
jgi:hypothetical protein